MVQLPTAEELQAIKRHVMIPMVLTVLQRDRKAIEESELKTKGPYVDMIEQAMKRAYSDIHDTRIYLRSKGIKIYEEIRTENTVDVKYVIRGYEDKASLPWHIVKNTVESMVRTYLGLME